MKNLIWKTGVVLLLPFVFAACDDSVSYAELLEEESKAVNSFLSDQTGTFVACRYGFYRVRRGFAVLSSG